MNIKCQKNIFKAPSSTHMFKNEAPLVQLPPTPVITRWRTWLDVDVYYVDYLTDIYY